jgi:hypothetical protein
METLLSRYRGASENSPPRFRRKALLKATYAVFDFPESVTDDAKGQCFLVDIDCLLQLIILTY